MVVEARRKKLAGRIGFEHVLFNDTARNVDVQRIDREMLCQTGLYSLSVGIDSRNPNQAYQYCPSQNSNEFESFLQLVPCCHIQAVQKRHIRRTSCFSLVLGVVDVVAECA